MFKWSIVVFIPGMIDVECLGPLKMSCLKSSNQAIRIRKHLRFENFQTNVTMLNSFSLKVSWRRQLRPARSGVLFAISASRLIRGSRKRLEKHSRKTRSFRKVKYCLRLHLMSFLIILFPDVENDDVLRKKIYFKR